MMMPTDKGVTKGLGGLARIATLLAAHPGERHAPSSLYPSRPARSAGLHHPGAGRIRQPSARLTPPPPALPAGAVYLDVGDQFQGSPWYSFLGGECEMAALQRLGCVAMAVGNHDL